MENLTNLRVYDQGSIEKEGRGMLQVRLFLIILGVIYIRMKN